MCFWTQKNPTTSKHNESSRETTSSWGHISMQMSIRGYPESWTTLIIRVNLVNPA